MAKYIEKCLEIIDMTFPFGWINTITFIPTKTDDYQIFLSSINKTSKELIHNLNLSVISGEYICDALFEEKLESFNSSLQNIFTLPDTELSEEDINVLSNTLISELISPYERALKYYRNLVSYSNTIINGNLHETVMDIFLHPDEVSENKKSAQLESINDFIKYNIKLAKFDLSIITSNQFLKELLQIKEELENKKNKNSIFDLLYNKCNFLIKKILLRYKKSNLSYKINFKSSELSPENFDSGPFKNFDNWIAAHDNNNPEIESKYNSDHRDYIEDSKRKFLKKEHLSYEDYHTLIRYYKDINPSQSKLKLLIESFEKTDINAINKFDKRAYNISLNYLHNNYFSFLLRDCEDLSDDIESCFKTIISIQKDTHVFNSFPYERLAKCYIKELNSIYEKNTSKTEIEKAKILLEKLETIIKELKTNYAWCEENKFLIYQLPFAECTFDHLIANENIKVFLQSSFVLPTNYTEDRNEIKAIKEDLISLNTIHKLHISISKEKEEIQNTKNEVKETKNKLDQSDKRNIEILSIFSAIVVFATATTQLFPFIKSTSAALQFMLVFSFSLCSFVLVIWLITRESEIRKLDFPILHKSFLAAFIFLTIVLGVESYYFREPNFIQLSEKLKTDSINISHLKKTHIIDSLKINNLNNRFDSLVKASPSLNTTSMQSHNH